MYTKQCPSCGSVIILQGVTDLVCKWSDNPFVDERKEPVAGVIEDGSLIVKLAWPHIKEWKMLSVKLGREVPVPTPKGTEKFRLREIHPGVLKLSPSLLDPELHAFVTIVGVPKNWSDHVPNVEE